MTDESRIGRTDDEVEDLDVPAEEADDVRGGGSASPTLLKFCATGKHLPEAKLTS